MFVFNQTSGAIDEPECMYPYLTEVEQCTQMWIASTTSGGEKLVQLVMLLQPMEKFHHHTNLSVQFSSDFKPQASRHTKAGKEPYPVDISHYNYTAMIVKTHQFCWARSSCLLHDRPPPFHDEQSLLIILNAVKKFLGIRFDSILQDALCLTGSI
jgi:hypothetical protein